MTRAHKRRQYGTGSVYQRASDGRWLGALDAGYTPTGARRRVTVSGKTEAEVKAKLRAKARELDRGEAASSPRTTVKAWADTWLDETAKTARPKTHTTDRGAVAKWIVPTIGHKRIAELTPADIRTVSNAIVDAGNTTTSAHRYHGTLMRLLKAAHAEGIAVPSRVLGVKPREVAVHDRQAVATPHALAMLEVAATMPHGSRWVAAFLQGMRQGECLGLPWTEVDADTLTVSWQLQALPYRDKRDRSKGFRIPDGYEARQIDRALHLVRPKSKAGWRVIPLVPFMADGLQRWGMQAPDSPHGLVWPWSSKHDRAEWMALQDAAGVRHPSGRHYHLHEARHSTATLLMELGVPESVRIAIMGHSNIATTRGYETVSTTEARRALEQVAERLQLDGSSQV